MKKIRARIAAASARSRWLNFNQVMRDEWVAQHARSVSPGSRVLDVGAGSAPYKALFGHCTYHTQDSATLGPEQCLGGAGYAEIDFRSDCSAIPVPDADYDVALCTEVLEHVLDPIAVLREIARILRVGGTLLLTAPLGSGLHQEPLHYYGGFTPHFYNAVLPRAGFRVDSIEGNGGFFRHFGQETQRLIAMTSPWRSVGPRHVRALAVPVWLGLWPISKVAPIVGALLDPLDPNQRFTVGYHVVATRT